MPRWQRQVAHLARVHAQAQAALRFRRDHCIWPPPPEALETTARPAQSHGAGSQDAVTVGPTPSELMRGNSSGVLAPAAVPSSGQYPLCWGKMGGEGGCGCPLARWSQAKRRGMSSGRSLALSADCLWCCETPRHQRIQILLLVRSLDPQILQCTLLD